MIEIIELIWMHWLADFVFQTDAMAQGKSKSNNWLAYHVAVYTACFLPFGWKLAIVNGSAHFVTDWLTSRATSHLWKKGDRHNFFVVIGLDQALHLTVLVLSAVLL